MPPKKRRIGRPTKKAGTLNPIQRAAKAASDAAVARGEPNPTPVGRPPTQEADPAIQLLSPTEKTAAAMGSGEDAGWISAAKRMRPD